MINITRDEAEKILKEKFGFQNFYDLQWKVIEKILLGQRILFIEKTGYGKSLCYQFPAILLNGVVIVFSPLIALMRDQVNSLKQKGIIAETINSNNTPEENNEIIEKAKNNQVNLLYIAPERMENIEWIQSARQMKIAMVVVDEAHCISTWGHNFRPTYRRIVNLVNLLPQDFPVLATTATATSRVEEDIKSQISGYLEVIRGRLMRPNLSLSVVKVKSEDEKFLWLKTHLSELTKNGTGVIYTGTKADSEIYKQWIEFLGYKSAYYNSSLEGEKRIEIENGFMNNRYHCVVATNALGMGIDKPDIRFIIHTQIPQSPIHYYQEVGRAGRDGNLAHIILLFNPDSDLELPKIFIDGSKPPKDAYLKVIELTKKEFLGRNDIIKKVNLKQNQVSVILTDLVEQGILNETTDGKSKKYFYNPNAGNLDFSSFENLRKHQLDELEKMKEYVFIKSCRMKFLCDYLGDYTYECGICDNEKELPFNFIDKSDKSFRALEEFKQNNFPILEVETKTSNIKNGVAASYYGFSNVGKTIHHCKYENGGNFPNWLLELSLKAFNKYFKEMKFDYVYYVPPTESGNLVRNFAEKFAEKINVPLSHNLIKSKETKPQKIFQSAISKKENVKDAFKLINPSEVVGKNILLIDDVFDSGATIKAIGNLLTKAGANCIIPIVIAKTIGGDITS